MSNDPRHQLGRQGEDIAVDHLHRRGYEIVERNYRTRWGELDVIARDGDALVFCEVKARRAPIRATACLESVHAHKRARLRKMAARWLIEHRDHPYAAELRFDAIGVSLDSAGRLVALEHIERAF